MRARARAAGARTLDVVGEVVVGVVAVARLVGRLLPPLVHDVLVGAELEQQLRAVDHRVLRGDDERRAAEGVDGVDLAALLDVLPDVVRPVVLVDEGVERRHPVARVREVHLLRVVDQREHLSLFSSFSGS